MSARILILEDDNDILELISTVLQEEGYEVQQRNVLFENVSEVERFASNLMIVDLFMGDAYAGWDFLQRLKKHPSTMSIPLILCTAATLTAEQERFTQLHGIPTMFKPFEIDALKQLVHQSVGPPAQQSLSDMKH
jgi:CheY-like chemotaxis protein